MQSKHPVFSRPPAGAPPCALAHLDEGSSPIARNAFGSAIPAMAHGSADAGPFQPVWDRACVLTSVEGDGHAWTGGGNLETGGSERLCLGSVD